MKRALLILIGFLLGSALHFALHEVVGCAEAPIQQPAVLRPVLPTS